MNVTSLPIFPQTPYSSPRAKHTPREQESNAAKQGLLSESEKHQVKKLQQRDREVRGHEQAHKYAAGAYAKGISYDYQRGPDGMDYAVASQARQLALQAKTDMTTTNERAVDKYVETANNDQDQNLGNYLDLFL